MSQIHLFATRADLLGLLEGLASSGSELRFVKRGWSPTAVPSHVYQSARELPNLGTADEFKVAYVMFLEGTEVAGYYVPGQKRYLINQLKNPDTVVLEPGGLWNKEALVSGSFGTVSESANSRRLFSQISRETKKSFNKIRAYYVGPEAEGLLRDGFRLTDAVQSPPIYDLRLLPDADPPFS